MGVNEFEAGKIIFKSVSPFGADENFVLEFEYNADEGLTAKEMARMCRSFMAAYGFSTTSLDKFFVEDLWEDNQE